MNQTVKTIAMGVLLCAAASPALGQVPAGEAQAVVEQLVGEALAGNYALREREARAEAQRFALEAAQRRHFPSLSLQARFTRAGGGRTIDLPLGTLLNPVYETLEAQRAAQGLPPAFPRLADEEIPFLREQEQETRVSLVQPLYQPRIRSAVRAQRFGLEAQEAEVAAFRARLTREVAVGYYGYLQAARAASVFEAAAELVAENLRVQQRLVASGSGLPADVQRARAETFAVAQRLAEAERDRDLARAALNALLGRDLATPLPTPADGSDGAPGGAPVPQAAPPLEAASLGALQDAAVERRDELDQLDAATRAQEAAVSLALADLRPSLALALDAGIQGRGYGLRDDAPFYLASVVLSWTIYGGGAERREAQQARALVAERRAQREDAALQIRLQVQQAAEAVRVARVSLEASEQQVEAAAEGFRLTRRLSEEGRASQVAFIDARTALTQAQLSRNAAAYGLLAALADLDFALGVIR
jgi:outer membrane protein TolC